MLWQVKTAYENHSPPRETITLLAYLHLTNFLYLISEMMLRDNIV